MHHRELLHGELLGAGMVPLDGTGRPLMRGGQPVRQGESIGMVFGPSPEEEALLRWQNGMFEEIERNNAKAWREDLKGLDPKSSAALLSQIVSQVTSMPKTFADCKALADEMIRLWNPEIVLMLGLALVGVHQPYASRVQERWRFMGRPPFGEFAPYFCYVCSVDLTFYLATAAGLVRDAGKASNKVDIAYLYYLPFCAIFISNDRLHRNLAPLFLRTNQHFITGDAMKADLAKLNSFYMGFPSEIRARGANEFAAEPPDDQSFLTTRLWDKYLPDWRSIRDNKNPPLSEEENRALVDEINSWAETGEPLEASAQITTDDCSVVTLSRKIALRKGDWRRFSPEIEAEILGNE
jgi:hypothetical protein